MNAREIEKMTILKLKEECLKIEGLSGVHGMSKTELIREMKKANDISLEEPKKPKASIKVLVKKIGELREQMVKARTEKNKQRIKYLQKRISSTKKRTRRV